MTTMDEFYMAENHLTCITLTLSPTMEGRGYTQANVHLAQQGVLPWMPSLWHTQSFIVNISQQNPFSLFTTMVADNMHVLLPSVEDGSDNKQSNISLEINPRATIYENRRTTHTKQFGQIQATFLAK